MIWPATVSDVCTKIALCRPDHIRYRRGAGDKGKEAIAARLDMLGVTLNSVQIVPHDAESIAAAITTSQADLVMILSGSATSDWADVAPTAISGGWKRASVCTCGSREFIVPWQHRTKTRNRFARMRAFACIERGRLGLSRVVCGLDVTDADFAQMAIGGLLKEIPTRPQPRRPKSRTK